MRRLLALPVLLAALTLSIPAAAEDAPCEGEAAEACADALSDLGARLSDLGWGDAQGEAAALSAAAAEVAYAFDDAGDIEHAVELLNDYVDAVEAGVSPEDAGVTLLQSHGAFELAAPLLYHPGMDPGVPMGQQDPEALKIRINWDKMRWFVNEFFTGVMDIITIVWDIYQGMDTGP